MSSRFLTYRAINIYTSLFIILILAYAVYTQVYQAQQPCPLCIMQRIVFIILGVLFIIGAIWLPRIPARRIYQCLIFLIALLGIAIAIRHIYLQHLPANLVPSCSPSFNFIITNFPFSAAMRLLLKGSTDCATVDWHLLGLTMPEWSLFCFILIAIISLFQLTRQTV